jgi:hypothetical protein
VRLGRQRADNEAAGDLGVGQSAGDEAEDFALALGQLRKRGGRLGRIAPRRELGD